jgi:membrane protein implicated in regulation of membrane protease activity
MNTLLQSGQFITFLTILCVGFVYIVGAWLFGSLSGGADSHDGDVHDGDSSNSHTDTISIFSPKIVAIFLVGFGAAGCVGTHYDASVIVSTVLGLAAGAAFGALAFGFMRLLYSQQSCSNVPTSAAAGQRAIVTTDITLGRQGEVSLYLNGQYMTYPASICTKSAPSVVWLPRGREVKVISATGPVLLVA